MEANRLAAQVSFGSFPLILGEQQVKFLLVSNLKIEQR